MTQPPTFQTIVCDTVDIPVSTPPRWKGGVCLIAGLALVIIARNGTLGMGSKLLCGGVVVLVAYCLVDDYTFSPPSQNAVKQSILYTLQKVQQLGCKEIRVYCEVTPSEGQSASKELSPDQQDDLDQEVNSLFDENWMQKQDERKYIKELSIRAIGIMPNKSNTCAYASFGWKSSHVFLARGGGVSFGTQTTKPLDSFETRESAPSVKEWLARVIEDYKDMT